MAGTMIPLAIETSTVNQACTTLTGRKLTNLESCLASGAGGFCGAYAVHSLDTWSTWQHEDPKSSRQTMRNKIGQSGSPPINRTIDCEN